jgi:outer membrane biosynthesis protein TonB
MNNYLYRSIGLHIAVFLLVMIDWPFFAHKPVMIGQAPIIIDLQDVKLAEMTNLPPKAVIGEEDRKETVKEEKKPTQQFTTTEPPAAEEEQQKQEDAKEEPKENFVDTTPAEEQKPTPEPKPEPTPKPTPKPVQKPVPKPAPKPAHKPTPKPAQKPATKTPEVKKAPDKKAETPKTVANPLKSLMDSVNTLEKEIGKEAAPAMIKKGTEVNNTGIEGGTGGSYFSDLTITETDAIAGRLRECWNLDPGARGIENMVIEIRAFLNKDGSVRDVQILDKARMNSDPHFRAIAESARRAVYTCSNKNNVNIYKIFPDKYADKYNLWNTLLLRFNPMDASIK